MTSSAEARIEPGFYRGPRTLSIMPTFTCPAECRDCGTLSSPRERTTLPLESILSAIDQGKRCGFANVVFTGGEATLRWKDLLLGIAHAEALGLPTRIVSNAYWATTQRRADEYVAKLKEAGLSEINYSTGDEHVRFVPLERVVNASIAAAKADLRVNVVIEARKERQVTEKDLSEHPRIRALSPELRKMMSFSEGPWMPLDPFRREDYADGTLLDSENVGLKTGCDSVLQAYVVEADGLIACCCGLGSRLIPELYVGRLDGDDSLKLAVEEAENDFLKMWLRYKGPEKILAWAAEKDEGLQWEDTYCHRCQVCLRLYHDPRIRQIVRENHEEMYADVLQSAYLDEQYTPGTLADALRQHGGSEDAASAS